MSVELAVAIVGISFVVLVLMKMFLEWQQAEIEAACWTAAAISAVIMFFIVWTSAPNSVPGAAYIFGAASCITILVGLAIHHTTRLQAMTTQEREAQY